MYEPAKRRGRGLQYAALAVLLITLLFILLTPSAHKLKLTGSVSRPGIFLSQVRAFFAVPLCAASGVGLLLSVLCPLEMRPLPRRVCRIAALVMAVLGAYFCVGFVGFQSYPPLSFEAGLYIMARRWIICLWWSAAAALLTLSAGPALGQEKSK